MSLRISPKTGTLAGANDADAIYEIFMEDHLPPAANAGNSPTGNGTQTRPAVVNRCFDTLRLVDGPSEGMTYEPPRFTPQRQPAPRTRAGGGAHHGAAWHPRLSDRQAQGGRAPRRRRSSALPRNTEIEDALAEYQRLFDAGGHEQTLQEQRRAALHAMHWLSQFEPRLVGPVLTGTATAHADIQLHLFADRAETRDAAADGSRHRA